MKAEVCRSISKGITSLKASPGLSLRFLLLERARGDRIRHLIEREREGRKRFSISNRSRDKAGTRR